MIYTALDNFYLSAEALAASPSRADGVSPEEEEELRRYGCDLIEEAGILLRQPQVVMATAQVLLQRFYCKRSLRKFDVKTTAMASFWLGAKLEEVVCIDDPARLTLRHVLMVFYRASRRREGRPLDVLSPWSQKYEETKAEVVRCERHMLRAFGFIVHVEHPQRFVLNYCQMLGLPVALQQRAWNLCNDSLRTTLCVRYRAEVVACGILFIAARQAGVPMPENPPWWALFEVSEDQLVEVCTALCDLYRQPQATYRPLARDFTSRAAAPGQASPPTAAATPMRSPLPAAVTPSAAVSLAGGGAVSAAAPAPAPSVQQQQPKQSDSVANGATSDKDRSTGAAGEASEPQVKEAAAEGGSRGRKDRRRSRSSSSSRSRSRSRSNSKGRRRSRNRSRERRRSRSREQHRSKQRRRSSRSRERPREQERLREQERPRELERGAFFRLGPPGFMSRPRDDRRRQGTHRRPVYGTPACAAA